MARKMKDSGIEWIGEIPEGWEVHRVKTHFSIISGSGFKPELQGQSTGDFPVCKASDISSSGHYLHTSANYITSDIVKSQHFSIIPKGSILFAKIGEAMRKNNRSLCLHDCCVDNNCQGLVPKNISSEFSYYLFTCIDMTWFDNAGTIPCINNQKLYDCRIPFPSYDEQLLISNHLNFQCAKINEMLFHIRSIIEEYKKLKQAVITQAVTKGVRGEREMKDSGVDYIGQIPAKWVLGKLRNVGDTQNGISKSSEFFGKGFPFVSYSDVYKNYSLPFAVSGLVESTPEEQERYSVKEGDIFFTRTSETIEEVGFSCVCEKDIPNATFAGFLIRVRPFSDKLYTPYAKYYFRSSHLRFYLVKEMNLVTRASLGQSLLKSMPVLLPPLEEQKEVADYLDAKCAEIDKLIAKKEQLVKELESYKKSLIYEVVTGKREV